MLVKSLALFAAALAVAPKPTFNPTKLPTALPHGTKAPALVSDWHASVPNPPAGLKVLVLTGDDLEITRHTGYAADVNEEWTQLIGRTRVHVPVGSTVEWLDCRFDLEAVKKASKLPELRAQLGRRDYGLPMSDNKFDISFTPMILRTLRKTGIYWHGGKVSGSAADRRAGPNHAFTLDVSYWVQGGDNIEFFGCRVGYRT